MKKLITAILIMVASIEMFGQMVWLSDSGFGYDQPYQFFTTKAGHYMIYHSGGIKVVDDDGMEIVEMTTEGIFQNYGSNTILDVIEMPDATFSAGTFSYGADSVSGEGWAFSSIIKFDQNGNGTLLAKDFYNASDGSLKAVLSDGSYVVLFEDGIIIKDTGGEVVQEISLYGVFDLLATSDDSLIVATEEGLVIMDRFGNIANTYPAFVFKGIKLDGLGRVVGVADSTITLLSADYQLLAQATLTGYTVKDFTVSSDSIAILTTSNMVRLYTGELSFSHEFPLGGNERYRYIARNKDKIALAGEEVYGDVASNQYSTTSFIKEYTLEGASPTFTEDIGITGIDLGNNVVIEPTGTNPNFNWVYFPDAKITVHNYGPAPVNQFYLRNANTNRAFNEMTILPDGEVTVPWPNLRKYTSGGYPAGMTVEVCAWTSQPNLSFDADASNDLFCTDFLVNDKVTIAPQSPIVIYPNPSSHVVNIQLPVQPSSNNAQLRVLDAMGRVMADMPTEEGNRFTLSVADWAAGVYFLQVLQDGAVSGSEKFIVAK